jgi:hypothetical protein
MTDREKLIELIRDGRACPIDRNPFDDEMCKSCKYLPDVECDITRLADHLLVNGVTFAKDIDVPSKWISVEDRLPELEKYKLSKMVLAWIKGHGRCFALRYDNGKGEQWFSGGVEQPDITHWMPLPEAPKED